MDTEMAKLCVECKFYESHAPAPAVCTSTHDHVVGDGIEGGALTVPCWQERSVGNPKEHAFHCGPDARYFDPKPEPAP